MPGEPPEHGEMNVIDDTALQTHDSKFETENATSRSRRLPIILFFLRVSGKKHLVSLKDKSGVRTRDLRLSKQAALITAPGPTPLILLMNKPQQIP